MRRLIVFVLITIAASVCNAQFNPNDTIVVCTQHFSGWNFVSNPVLRERGTDSCRQVFCNIAPIGPCGCFGMFIGGGYYQQGCIAENGRGYWIKVPGGTNCCISGGTIAQDTIDVTVGWNAFGTISYPIDTSSVTTIPPGIRASSYFGYSIGYLVVTTLQPGQGYWVKMRQAGRLVLSSGL